MVKKRVKKVKVFGDISKPKKKQNKFLGFLSNGLVAILIFLVGIYFLAPTVTGNAIGNLSFGLTNIIGIVLIAIAIGGHYFLIKFLNSY